MTLDARWCSPVTLDARWCSPVTRAAEVHLHVEQLLAHLETQKNAVWPASLTAQEAQDIRMDLLMKVRKLIDELLEVRNAKDLAEEGQVHVYKALGSLIRMQSSIISDASLDEIQAMLEDADAEISQIQPPQKGSGKASK